MNGFALPFFAEIEPAGKPIGYEALKATAKQMQLTMPDLLVLARQNDPFFCGSPAQVAQAEWFAGLWQRFGYSRGVHLRRVHYQLLGDDYPTKHDGTPYENTEGCWGFLCSAGKYARYLGMIDAHAFEDHRNADPLIHAFYGDSTEPMLEKPEWFDFRLPSIESDLGWELDLAVPDMTVSGYGYWPSRQPFHLEVWVEKSTMDDVLLPVCQRYGINLVTSIGFQSVTSVVDLLRRVYQSRKPARILYISDFDPAGDGMPVAVARQLEYWLDRYAPGADIKLQPLVLTSEQVLQYSLPPIPIKESDRRRESFTDRYGVQGATELDALEARRPGELARILEEAILPYRDKTLPERCQYAGIEASEIVAERWAETTQEQREELAALEGEIRLIVGQYSDTLSDLNERLQGDLAPIAEQVRAIRHAIQRLSDGFEIDLPVPPAPRARGQDESAWLFDSQRDWRDQLGVYHARKAGNTETAEVWE